MSQKFAVLSSLLALVAITVLVARQPLGVVNGLHFSPLGGQHQAVQPETDEEWLSEFRKLPPVNSRVCDMATADEEKLELICQELRESNIPYDLTIIGRATTLFVRQIDLETSRHICANTP